MIPTVACVLRSGGDFGPEHVAPLFRGVISRWPLCIPTTPRFVVFTDGLRYFPDTRPLSASVGPGWWAKMEMFNPAHDDLGDILYFDLDTVLVGKLDAIVAACAHAYAGSMVAPVMLRDFGHSTRVQSGMMYLPVKVRRQTWLAWKEDPGAVMRRFRGDGEFLNSLWCDGALRWDNFVPGQIVSYKKHVRSNNGVVPLNARVVCYHGKPRPWETPLWREHA